MATVCERITALREKMKENGITVYVVPSTDCHESEYVCPHYRARAYMTGFTGSAGTAVITMDKAGLWTDGRYFLQAAQELSGSGICGVAVISAIYGAADIRRASEDLKAATREMLQA